MFIRQKRNKLGSISVQIISKSGGRYKVVESIGSGKSEQEISSLRLKARSVLRRLQGNLELFTDEEESQYENIFSPISNNQI